MTSWNSGLRNLEQQNAELAQANKILTDDRGQLEALLETTPDNIYFKDRESRFVRMSRAKAESTMHAVRNAYRSAHPNDKPDDWPPHLTGVKSFTEWLIGKTDFDTFPNEHARMALAEEQGIIATGQPMIGKLQKVIRHDGTSVWLLTTKLPWRDKDGSIIGTLGVTRNVTELKEAEESLDRERILLRTVIDNLPDAIYAKDTAGRKTLANPADLKNLRCATETEAIGKSDFDLFPKELAEKFWADDLKVIAGQPVINREEYLFDEAGRKRWLLTSKLPLRNPDGKIAGLIGIGRDITLQKQAEDALRQSEEKLREVMRRTRCVMNSGEVEAPEGWREHALDPVSPFRWHFPVANVEAAQEVFPLDVPPNKHYQQVWTKSRHSDDFGQMNRVSGEAFLNNSPFYRSEFRCTDKHGVEHWMQQFVTVNKLTENRWQLFGITTDITDLKRTESALRSSEEKSQQFAQQLERSNHELQDFAYVASHDLQEPLRKITVFSERLKERNAGKLSLNRWIIWTGCRARRRGCKP